MKSECDADYETIDAFVSDLLRFDDSIPLESLERSLQRLALPESFIKSEATFNAHGYSRTSLYSSSKFEVLLLCWESAQRSPIHDHLGSKCAFKVLQGTAIETRFEMTPDGQVVARGSSELPEGTVRASQDQDIHQMSNDQVDASRLVTLHIYSPPLRKMNTYSLLERRDENRDRMQVKLLASAAE